MAVWKGQASSSQVEERELPPEGTHAAVLVALVDLGTHEETFGGQDPEWRRKVYLAWELTAEESHPVVGRDFTLSFHTKALLRQFLERWRGKQFSDGEEVNVAAALGKNCLVTVKHTTSGDRKFPKVDSVSGVPRGTNVPPARHKPFLWSLDDGDARAIPDWLPYLFGSSLAQWVETSRERKPGARGRDPRQNESSEKTPAGSAFEAAGKETQPDEVPF